MAFTAGALAHGGRQLLEEIRRRVVPDGIYRIQPQAVEVVFLRPVEGVVDEEAAHRLAAGAIEVEGCPPGGVMVFGEKLRGILVQEIALGTKMVVHHIQQDHQPLVVRRLDQVLQVLRPAIAAVRGEGEHSVVGPSCAYRESRRSALDGGDTQVGQVIQAPGDGGEAALRRKCAHMQLIDDRRFPRSSMPIGIGPPPTPRIDDLAGAMHILGLKPGCGIGHPQPAIDAVMITAPGRGPVRHQAEPASRLADQGQDRFTGVRFEAELDPSSRGGPEAEMHSPVGLHLGAEGHGVNPAHGITYG